MKTAILARQVGKTLKKQGFKKRTLIRENFKTIIIGDYEVGSLTRFGMNIVYVQPTCASKLDNIFNVLSSIYKCEVVRGVIKITS